jgi:hypothetical protein
MPRALRIVVLVLALALGGCAIAGARTHAVPAAASITTTKAPRGGAFSITGAVAKS